MKKLLRLLVVIVCAGIASAQINSELSMPPNGGAKSPSPTSLNSG